MKPCYCSFSH